MKRVRRSSVIMLVLMLFAMGASGGRLRQRRGRVDIWDQCVAGRQRYRDLWHGDIDVERARWTPPR